MHFNLTSISNALAESFGIMKLSFGVSAVIDIIIVTVLFYFAFLFLRETRALGIIYGLLILAVAWFIGQSLELVTLNTILRWSITSLLVAFPVVFQPELRVGLEKLGRSTHFVTDLRRLSKSDIERMVEEVVQALRTLARNRYGALVIFTRTTGLQAEINSGEIINAQVSPKLLINIFTPKAPLHDGAVIIQGNKIVCASATLPLSDDVLDLSLGTRHKAALSLAKTTDAVAVVVSEETGRIALAVDQKIEKNISLNKLAKKLTQLLRVKSPQLKKVQR